MMSIECKHSYSIVFFQFMSFEFNYHSRLEMKGQVYVIPFPSQSHINPMLDFSKCLASNPNLHITFILTTEISKLASAKSSSGSIRIETISDGSEDDTETSLFDRLETVFSKNVEKFIEKEQSCADQIKHKTRTPLGASGVLVYDSGFPWMLDIAHNHGLLAVSFFTQSCSACALYYFMKEGTITYPYKHSYQATLPFLPTLEPGDLPLFSKLKGPIDFILRSITNQFSNIHKADFLLFNTFAQLEKEVVDWMASQWPVKTVGPINLLSQRDNKNKHVAISKFESNHEVCMKWLDSREIKSVVYVSFGSLVSLEKDQIEELACGLTMTQCPFLWVLRASEHDKLPSTFTSLVSTGKGLIVNWCSQPDVLAHPAVACFLTHGGWNSTIEGLSCGVPLVVMPCWVDQSTNAKFIEDVWRVGKRTREGENGIVTREEVCECVKEVVQGMEHRLNAIKWRELAKEAVEDGGTSANNIKDIVSAFSCF